MEDVAKVGITKHRQRILDVLQEWFRTHEQGPTLEELCQLLGMHPRQKATVQRWLQTMRGIDVEWEAHIPRSLRLLISEMEDVSVQMPVTETLRYLATGLVEWEKRSPQTRSLLPEALRIGMSRMYLTALLQGEEAPGNLRELFEKAEEPVLEWLPNASEIKNLSPNVTLVEDGIVSDFATDWQVDGRGVVEQVQESVMQDVLEHCRRLQLDDAYRAFRQVVVTKPTIPYTEYRRLLATPIFHPLREYLRQTYVELEKLAEYEVYYRCPRCQYPQRRRSDGTYCCRNVFCERLSAKSKPPLTPLLPIPKAEANQWMVVTPGMHKYVTVPGLWEIFLYESLTRLGVRVTLWPQIDEYDLLIELPRKVRWAIDVKDWGHLRLDRLKQVQYRLDVDETFVVFPKERERWLRLKVVRDQYEAELGGVRLRLIDELIEMVKEITGSKDHA